MKVGDLLSLRPFYERSEDLVAALTESLKQNEFNSNLSSISYCYT